MNFALNKHSIYLKMALRGIMYSPSIATARQLIKYYSAEIQIRAIRFANFIIDANYFSAGACVQQLCCVF